MASCAFTFELIFISTSSKCLPIWKAVCLTGSYGDSITISLTTPITVKSFSPIFTVSPTGFLRFINFTAVSFNTMADESVIKRLEKSLPSVNCQPTVFPYSGVTPIQPKKEVLDGSFPFHSISPLLLLMPVVELDDSATCVILPEFSKSCLTASKCLCRSSLVTSILTSPFLS